MLVRLLKILDCAWKRVTVDGILRQNKLQV